VSGVLQYRAAAPGGWLAVAVPGCALLVEAREGAPFDAAALRCAMRSDEPIPSVLDVLATGGFGAMPTFGLVEHRGQSAHYVVRGTVSLSFDGPDGPRSASGAGVTTWSEQLVAGMDRFIVSAGAGDDGQAPPALLPLADGAVWASRLEWCAAAAVGEADAAGPVTGDGSGAAPARATAAATRPTDVPHETLLPEATLADSTTGYDHLFGVTMIKGVEAAAVRPVTDDDPDQTAVPEPVAPVTEGDHDGLTMMSSQIAELRRAAAGFRLELPDGTSEALDRPVVVGRAPSASKVSAADLPRLITVGASDPDISRNHVRFTVEGETVVITDLHSRNGTVIELPGRPPQKLRAGEPTSALSGTVVDLGGGIRITVTGQGA
jgi:hypothetical protein